MCLELHNAVIKQGRGCTAHPERGALQERYRFNQQSASAAAADGRTGLNQTSARALKEGDLIVGNDTDRLGMRI